MLLELIRWLEANGTQDIFIVDNASTYIPLLDYYAKTSHNVIRLKENVGYLAFWEIGIHERFRDRHFIYTDPDVVPTEDCPKDYLDVFFEGLARYPDIGKVGFSLKIDDLPDGFALKKEVIQHESRFWLKKRDQLFFDAPIDTTFALYRPKSRGGYWVPGVRTAPPYVARHLPWYINSSAPTDEEIFYRNHVSKDASWAMRALELSSDSQ
jgi:hypothetical protein